MRLVRAVADRFTASSGTESGQNFEVNGLFQEFDGSVGHQTLGTAGVAAAHVVFKGWSLIYGKCLIKDIEPVDPLTVGID